MQTWGLLALQGLVRWAWTRKGLARALEGQTVPTLISGDSS